MKEDTITAVVIRLDQLQRETIFTRKMLTSETTFEQDQEDRAKRKGKVKTNDKGKVVVILHSQK
jgi:hypothetical protein